jgi:hypothetical protein
VCDRPWWEAARAAGRPVAEGDASGQLVDLEARLGEADGRRVWAQRRARQELAARGEPVTRLSVARWACELLGDVQGAAS